MAKVITFSRVFPSYHPRAGEPTHFVEAIINSLYRFLPAPKEAVKLYDDPKFQSIRAKHHTIRAGHRFKAGDWFSPRVWSGKPYNSKQIIFAPDTEVKKTWDFEICGFGAFNDAIITINGQPPKQKMIPIISSNDGLTEADFSDWFCLSPEFKKKKYFEGQIICWNENINY